MSSAATAVDNQAAGARILRPTFFLVGGVVVLVIIGVVVAVIASRRPAATFPPHSPQGTVATYLRLLQDGKVDQAYLMTDITFGPEGLVESRSTFHQQFDSWGHTSHRITLTRTTAVRNWASVSVQISAFSGNVLGGSDQSNQQTIALTRRDGAWRITGPPYLYP